MVSSTLWSYMISLSLPGITEKLVTEHPYPAGFPSRTNIHGQVHTEVHVLSPGILHWILTHHGEDATVQVGLASRLMIPGHSNDRGPGTVSGHLVSGPRMGQESSHKRPIEVS